MGSMLCGSHEFIERAMKARKRIGGAQRQVGIAAAAGLYALKNNIPRLSEDHDNAKLLCELLIKGGVHVEEVPNMTNMVFFPMLQSYPTDEYFVSACKERGLLLNALSPRRIRLVTHLDVNREDVERAAGVILEVISQ